MKHSPSLVANKPSLQTGRARCQGEAPLSSAVLHKHQGKRQANVSCRDYRSEEKETCVGCVLPSHRKHTECTRNQCKDTITIHTAPTSAITNNTGMTNPQSKDNSSDYFKLSLNAFMLMLAGIWPHYKFNHLGFFWWEITALSHCAALCSLMPMQERRWTHSAELHWLRPFIKTTTLGICLNYIWK